MKEDLSQRLIAHYDNQIDYYERQKRDAEKFLSRIIMQSSGQLTLWEENHSE